MDMAFVVLQRKSLAPFGVEKGAFAPGMARMLFVCSVGNRGVLSYLREKELSITKEAWHLDCTGLVVSAKKGDAVSRW